MAGSRNESYPVGGEVHAGPSLADKDHVQSKKIFRVLSIDEAAAPLETSHCILKITATCVMGLSQVIFQAGIESHEG
jgi:hypothetical protein